VRTGNLTVKVHCGGEEFMAVLPDTDAAGAARLAKIIREKIEALGLWAGLFQ